MSLDVYLEYEGVQHLDGGEHIFIREGGQNKEITREEWDKRFPDKEPVIVMFPDDTEDVYSGNITHNLNKMADEAGIYEALWRPEEINAHFAKELVPLLTDGLRKLLDEPDKFKQFNPSNGWGNYEGLVQFVTNYLNACLQYPDAIVRVSR